MPARRWRCSSTTLDRLAGWILGAQCPLPPPDVVPAAELPADPLVHPHGLESERLVEAHARLVGQRDAGAGHLESLVAEPREQGLVQGAADAAALAVRRHIDRDVGRPPVARALAVPGGVGVPDYLLA